MKRLLLSQLIFTTFLSSIALSLPIQIPIVPFDDKPPHVSYKTHKRCKLSNSYAKCIDRSERKVTTSLYMDY